MTSDQPLSPRPRNVGELFDLLGDGRYDVFDALEVAPELAVESFFRNAERYRRDKERAG